MRPPDLIRGMVVGALPLGRMRRQLQSHKENVSCL